VIIITGWVSKDTVENRLIDLALYLVELPSTGIPL